MYHCGIEVLLPSSMSCWRVPAGLCPPMTTPRVALKVLPVSVATLVDETACRQSREVLRSTNMRVVHGQPCPGGAGCPGCRAEVLLHHTPGRVRRTGARCPDPPQTGSSLAVGPRRDVLAARLADQRPRAQHDPVPGLDGGCQRSGLSPVPALLTVTLPSIAFRWLLAAPPMVFSLAPDVGHAPAHAVDIASRPR
jgi:hypothetical protein